MIKNQLELRKLWPSKVEGVKNSKNKPLNITKPIPTHPKKLLVCCYVAIKVEIWFVELKVAFL
jgi:hypothetical protein